MVLFTLQLLLIGFITSSPLLVPTNDQIKELSGKLSASTGLLFGTSCSQRHYWDDPRRMQKFIQDYLPKAELAYNQSFPPFVGNTYREFRTTGNRENGENMINERSYRMNHFALAECIFNNGNYTSKLNEALSLNSGQASWAWPAHDSKMLYFSGTKYFVELNSARMASWMGTILHLVGPKITKAIREKVISQITTRVIHPVLQSLQSKEPFPEHSWMNATSNWNPVCWLGVVISAASVVENPIQRATIYYAAYLNAKNYFEVYTEDGWNAEGPSYFNMGFGDYAMLREALYRATDGHLDLFDTEVAGVAARYALQSPMTRLKDVPNSLVSPDFGDCLTTSTTLQTYLVDYLQFVYGFRNRPLSMGYLNNQLTGILLKTFSDVQPPKPSVIKAQKIESANSIRSYFEKSGILVARPRNSLSDKGLAAAFKLLGNKGGHSHNDIGSYVVYLNGVKICGDLGTVRYTKDSFGTKRYESGYFSSFGHPVPLVDGREQIVASNRSWNLGEEAIRPLVLGTNFSEDQDEITYDLKAAYPLPSLLALNRKIVYSRTNPSILVTDSFSFSEPSVFETPLITQYNWTQLSSTLGYFENRNEKLYASAFSSKTPFEMISETIQDAEYNESYSRIKLVTKERVLKGSITYQLTPEEL